MRAYLAQPEWLWLLAAVPVLAGRAFFGRMRRRRDWEALGRPGGGKPYGEGTPWRLLAASCVVLALATPHWGRSTQPPLPPGHDVVLAVDVSRSMAAEDAVPDRLGRAVEAASGLLDELGKTPGERVAVVAFAGRGVLKCPLTANLGAAADALRALRPGSVQPGGTDLASALESALDAFDDQDRAEGRTVVVFSDGEDHPAAWRGTAERAKEQGVIVHAVAVGDAETGHPIPVRTARDASGAAEPLRFEGEVVLSKRSDEALRAIADATGGAFVPLGLSAADLGALYRERIEPGARARRTEESVTSPQPAERFGVFLAAAVGLGLASSRPPAGRAHPAGRWVTVTAAAFLSGAAVAALGAGPAPGAAALVEAGRAAYDAGRFDEALQFFRRAQAVAPDSAVPLYDAAEALLRLGRPDEARAAYVEARPLADPGLRARVDYALGNAAVALGDLTGAVRHYDECLAAAESDPALGEVFRRALANKKYVEEHAQKSPQTPDGEKDPDRPGDGRPDDQGKEAPAPKEKESGSGDQPGGSEGPRPAPSPDEPGKAPRGGGGGGPNSSRDDDGSPEQRLERALENVREALRSRDDSERLPSSETSRDVKDW